jgi:hypothetical protein
MDDTMDKSLGIGSEVTLSKDVVKHVKIGSVGLIREVRGVMKGVNYRFSFCIGREKETIAGEDHDFPAAEATYRKAFGLVLVEGLTDEEYIAANAEELDKLLDRFL